MLDPSSRSLLRIFFVSVVLAVGLTGCDGGGGDTNSTSTRGASPETEVRPESVETSSLSREEYLEQAENICRSGNSKYLQPFLTYMNEHAKPNQDKEELVGHAVHAVFVPRFRALIEKLRSLGAPAGDEQKIEALIAAMLSAAERLEQRRKFSLTGDIEHELKDVSSLALRYGILNCSY